ncbi:MAG TPA: lactate utilization protein [Bacillota bacterium]|nr:lactate utilization protein [Bacillota bacterium]
MNSYRKWQCQCIAREAVDFLKKKHYDAHYTENLEEARNLVLSLIPAGSSIALGGSETIRELDIIDTFRNGDYRLFDRYQKLPWEQILEIMRQSLLADYLITGTNAITRQGELVNLDSTGNRVAGMIFGPKKVIVVTGANKVVDTLEDALKRLKEISPMNAKRVGHETPCVKTGKCMNCDKEQRICNYLTVIHHGMKFEGRITVIMIAEDLGF